MIFQNVDIDEKKAFKDIGTLEIDGYDKLELQFESGM
jgi:hypothetical protein